VEGKDGYNAVQLAFGSRKEKNVSKSEMGILKAAGATPARFVREIRVVDVKGFEVGQTVVVDGIFKPGDYVDVQSVSKGKGFSGAMKRHNFAGLPASHGASDKERSPGSIASRRSLGRVLPGQRMAGRHGGETTSVMKLEVLKVDPKENLLYLYGSVPGPSKGLVRVSETKMSKKFRVEFKKSFIKRDKMGNIIKSTASARGAAKKK
jgi:large subunit ribosomal protein L3